MIHVYLDDYRPCPTGFVVARNASECLLLLEECKVDILSLDHDLGWEEPDGTELAKQMVKKQLFARRIYLHSSDPLARKRMYELLYVGKPDHVTLFMHPVPYELLEEIKARHTTSK